MGDFRAQRRQRIQMHNNVPQLADAGRFVTIGINARIEGRLNAFRPGFY